MIPVVGQYKWIDREPKPLSSWLFSRDPCYTGILWDVFCLLENVEPLDW